MDEIEQGTLKNSIEFVGIQETQNENVTAIVNKIAATCGINDLGHKTVYRKKSTKTKNTAIVVSLANGKIKEAIKDQIKQNRTRAKDIGIRGAAGEKSIYANDLLTDKKRELLWKARKLVRDGLVKFAWTKGGRIYIRKRQGCPAIRVVSESDLPMQGDEPTEPGQEMTETSCEQSANPEDQGDVIVRTPDPSTDPADESATSS